MIPLISTLCKGPLGAAQLPRLWWKNLLYATGQLDASYPHCTGGLDLNVIELLQLDQAQTLAYLHEEKPSYLQFEAWVEANGRVHAAHVERWNKSLETRTHWTVAKIDETYGDIGFDKDRDTEVSSVLLNCLQDWQLFFRNDLGGGLGAIMPPLLSSIDQGSLGICQLPRTWLKTGLRAKGLLHADYPDCAEGSLDQRCLHALALDQDKTLAYLREELPSYVDFENWVRQQGTVDSAAIAAFNERLLQREHNEAKRQDIHATLGRPQTWTAGVLINNLEDWHYGYSVLMQL